MQHTTELAERLAGIASELMQLAKSLGNYAAREPQFPEDAVRKYVAGICLRCSKTKDEVKGSFRRGNCPSCSRVINNELNRAPSRIVLENQFIVDGLLAPEHFRIEPDPIASAIAKVSAVAEHHYADPELKPPGRKRASRKK